MSLPTMSIAAKQAENSKKRKCSNINIFTALNTVNMKEKGEEFWVKYMISDVGFVLLKLK